MYKPGDDKLEVRELLVKAFARQAGCIIAVTGAIDLVSDGERCWCIRNGRPEMSRITGTGCQLSALTTAFLVANPEHKLEAAAAAVCMMGLAGEIGWDEGEVMVAPSKRLGLISQIPVYPEGWTVEQVLRDAHRHIYAVAARMNELEAQMEHDQSPELLKQYDKLQADFARPGGYEMDVERSRVANGLDIPPAMLAQPFDSLSGGEKTRVNLARLILEDTDILLLDEPTNHLDLHATE